MSHAFHASHFATFRSEKSEKSSSTGWDASVDPVRELFWSPRLQVALKDSRYSGVDLQLSSGNPVARQSGSFFKGTRPPFELSKSWGKDMLWHSDSTTQFRGTFLILLIQAFEGIQYWSVRQLGKWWPQGKAKVLLSGSVTVLNNGKMNFLPFAKQCLLVLLAFFPREYLKVSHVVWESKGPFPGLHTKGLQIGLPIIEGGLSATGIFDRLETSHSTLDKQVKWQNYAKPFCFAKDPNKNNHSLSIWIFSIWSVIQWRVSRGTLDQSRNQNLPPGSDHQRSGHPWPRAESVENVSNCTPGTPADSKDVIWVSCIPQDLCSVYLCIKKCYSYISLLKRSGWKDLIRIKTTHNTTSWPTNRPWCIDCLTFVLFSCIAMHRGATHRMNTPRVCQTRMHSSASEESLNLMHTMPWCKKCQTRVQQMSACGNQPKSFWKASTKWNLSHLTMSWRCSVSCLDVNSR